MFQLSHYLDVVEVQIAKQISLRSEAFFHAMTSHDQLQVNMSSTCKTIHHLRSVYDAFKLSFAKSDLLHVLDLMLSIDFDSVPINSGDVFDL